MIALAVTGYPQWDLCRLSGVDRDPRAEKRPVRCASANARSILGRSIASDLADRRRSMPSPPQRRRWERVLARRGGSSRARSRGGHSLRNILLASIRSALQLSLRRNEGLENGAQKAEDRRMSMEMMVVLPQQGLLDGLHDEPRGIIASDAKLLLREKQQSRNVVFFIGRVEDLSDVGHGFLLSSSILRSAPRAHARHCSHQGVRDEN